MRSTKSLGAIAMIVLGALFIILKGSVISIAMTLVGVVLILFGKYHESPAFIYFQF